MTISNDVALVEAAGDGVAAIFSFDPMVIASSSELRVWYEDAAGSRVQLIEGTGSLNYSVSVSSYPGTGFITYPASGGTPVPVGDKIIMERDTAITQEIDFENQGSVFQEKTEIALDKGQRIDAELRRDIDENADAISNLASVPPSTQIDAIDVRYNNLASGLTATDVQAAIDEIDADVDNLPNVFVPNTRQITTSGPIAGGGDLSSDVDIGMDTVPGLTPGPYTNTNLTVDEYGRVIAAANGTGGGGGYEINVRDYGAVGDGVTDDLAAFNAAIAALPADNATLVIPSGHYILSAQLNPVVDRDINVFGSGAAAVKLDWPNANGGMVLDVTRVGSYLLDHGHRFNVRGITFQTGATSSGTGLRIFGTHALGRVDVANTLHDLTFVGVSDTSAWNIGIDLDEVAQISGSKIKIDGRTAAGEGTAKGIRIFGDDNSNNFSFENMMMTWCDRAISVEYSGGGSGFGPEGVQILNSHFVAVNYGVHGLDISGSANAASEGLIVSATHIAAEKACIIGYFSQTVISNSLLYDRPGSGSNDAFIQIPTSSAYAGHTQIIIESNHFIAANGTAIQGMLLGDGGGSGDLSRVLVRDNFFSISAGATAIIFFGNTSRCFTSNNVVANANSVSDAGSRNSIGDRSHLGYLNADQAVGNNTNHAVTWTAEGADPEGLITVGSSVINIPANSGIQRIIIKASIAFAGNNVGHRAMLIEQNTGGGFTGNWVGSPGNAVNPEQTMNLVRMYCETPTINVAPGYQYRVIAQQTSGGNLNLVANRTWIEVEVVE